MSGATASALRAAARASPPSGVGSATTPATSSGSAVARPLTAPVAPAAMARGMSGSEPTKTSRPSREVRLDLLEGAVGHLHPAERGVRVAQPLDDCGRDDVARPVAELVDVGRRRRARRDDRGEVRLELGGVEGEVRRADDRDGRGAGLRGVLGQRDRLGGRLRARVHGDLEPVGDGVGATPRRARDARPWRAGGPLPRRPRDEDAVAPAGRDERAETVDRALVEARPSVAQRRHDRGHRSVQRHVREHIHRPKPINAVGIRVRVA